MGFSVLDNVLLLDVPSSFVLQFDGTVAQHPANCNTRNAVLNLTAKGQRAGMERTKKRSSPSSPFRLPFAPASSKFLLRYRRRFPPRKAGPRGTLRALCHRGTVARKSANWKSTCHRLFGRTTITTRRTWDAAFCRIHFSAMRRIWGLMCGKIVATDRLAEYPPRPPVTERTERRHEGGSAKEVKKRIQPKICSDNGSAGD